MEGETKLWGGEGGGEKGTVDSLGEVGWQEKRKRMGGEDSWGLRGRQWKRRRVKVEASQQYLALLQGRWVNQRHRVATSDARQIKSSCVSVTARNNLWHAPWQGR